MECRSDPENGDFGRKCRQKMFEEIEIVVTGLDAPEDPKSFSKVGSGGKLIRMGTWIF